MAGSALMGGLKELVTTGGASEAASSDAWRTIWNFTGTKEAVEKLHPNAAAVMDLDKQFVYQRNKIYSKLEEPSQKLWKGISSDSKLMQKYADRNTPIAEIHRDLSASKHPLAIHSGQILAQNVNPRTGLSRNADLTFQTLGFSNKTQSNRLASDQVFGPKMQNVMPHIQELLESNNPQHHSIAQMLLEVLSNDSHDTFEVKGAPHSRIAWDVRKAVEKENKARAKFGDAPQMALPKTASTYTPQTPKERLLHSLLVNRLAAFAALPHVPMFGNLMSSPMTAIVKGLVSMRDDEIKALATASGILANTQHSMFYNDMMGRTGMLGKVGLSMPGAFLYKAFHMPFFDWLRFHQLSLAASVGYHSAVEWASEAASGDKRALAELAEMKLNPQEIIAQGGKLNEDQMQQAMFHYVNNRMFVDRPYDRSLRSNSSYFMRSATMFHSIVVSQYRFMQREIGKMVKTGDIKGLAQFAGTLGILFPAVMPWLHAAEVLGRTLSPQQAKQAEEKDYAGLTNPKSVGDWTLHYANMLAYLGGFGIYRNIILSAHGDRLGAALLGPITGSAVQTVQDSINAIANPIKQKRGESPFEARRRHYGQLGRDISEFTVPVVGKWMAHKFFPTLAEEKAEEYPSRRRRGRR